MISFDQIMQARALEMAKKGHKPEAPQQQAPQAPQQQAPMPQGQQGQVDPMQIMQMLQGGAGQEQQGPPVGESKQAAIMRRMQMQAPEGADPRAFLNKLPPEIANLAARYRRI